MDTQSHCPVPLQSLAEAAELLLSIGSRSVRPLSLPGDSFTGAASHIRKKRIARGRGKKQKNTRTQDESYRRSITLPDNVLLEIFDFYVNLHDFNCTNYCFHNIREWHLLVHVCRRWRQIVFASPHRLNLQIFCKDRTPVRKSLDIWPAFPIVVDYVHWDSLPPNDEDNAIAALEQPDRVCHVRLWAQGWKLEKITAAMQEPFPVLTHLLLTKTDDKTPDIPSGFLGGSAPCLQVMDLHGISFPTLPTLILSASNLVELRLLEIPPACYVSPEAMVACLAALPRLAIFDIHIPLATSRSHPIHLSPVTPTVLPALTTLEFKGASEYLEDLVTRIDCPQLNSIGICYHNQLADFQVAQLSNFFDLSLGPKLTPFRFAEVGFQDSRISFNMGSSLEVKANRFPVKISIHCKGVDWQVSHIAQVLSQFSATLSNVVHLKLDYDPWRQLEGMDDVEWLHLLRQFSTVQTLRVSREFARHIALVLEDITGEMVTGVLPSLYLIYLKGQPTSSVKKFIAARRLSDRPVTVFDTEAEFLTSVN